MPCTFTITFYRSCGHSIKHYHNDANCTYPHGPLPVKEFPYTDFHDGDPCLDAFRFVPLNRFYVEVPVDITFKRQRCDRCKSKVCTECLSDKELRYRRRLWRRRTGASVQLKSSVPAWVREGKTQMREPQLWEYDEAEISDDHRDAEDEFEPYAEDLTDDEPDSHDGDSDDKVGAEDLKKYRVGPEIDYCINAKGVLEFSDLGDEAYIDRHAGGSDSDESGPSDYVYWVDTARQDAGEEDSDVADTPEEDAGCEESTEEDTDEDERKVTKRGVRDLQLLLRERDSLFAQAPNHMDWDSDHRKYFREVLEHSSVATRPYVFYTARSQPRHPRSFLRPLAKRSIKEKCGLCHKRFNNQRPYQLPCGHSFHLTCIKTWLGKESNPTQPIKDTCPDCKLEYLNVLRPSFGPRVFAIRQSTDGNRLLYAEQVSGWLSFHDTLKKHQAKKLQEKKLQEMKQGEHGVAETT